MLNFDLPSDSKTYVHRVGRTARAGKSGMAFSFLTQYDIEVWQRIERALGKELDEYKVKRDEVMVFVERVAEAQRQAIMEMKTYDEKKGNKANKKGGGKRSRGEMDEEEG